METGLEKTEYFEKLAAITMGDIEQQRTIDSLEVILKLTERCNIDCSYCYFFNKNDQSYKDHPPILREEMATKLANYIKQGVIDLHIKNLSIDLHGGEPLIMNKKRFSRVMEIFRTILEPFVELRILLQTNGMLVNKEWIDIFKKYKISVSVSLDGNKKYNDLQRIDHKGRGTYDGTVKGLKKLMQAGDNISLPKPGVLCVIDPTYDGGEILAHFRRELELENVAFLLPIESYDSNYDFKEEDLAKYLCDAFSVILEDFGENKQLHERMIERVLYLVVKGASGFQEQKDFVANCHRAIVVSSSGEISLDDTLKPIQHELLDSSYSIHNSTLSEFLNHPVFEQLIQAFQTLPNQCNTCLWKNICHGGHIAGHLINRYSKENGFENPSIFCESLQKFYGFMVAELVKKGYSFEKMYENICYQ